MSLHSKGGKQLMMMLILVTFTIFVCSAQGVSFYGSFDLPHLTSSSLQQQQQQQTQFIQLEPTLHYMQPQTQASIQIPLVEQLEITQPQPQPQTKPLSIDISSASTSIPTTITPRTQGLRQFWPHITHNHINNPFVHAFAAAPIAQLPLSIAPATNLPLYRTFDGDTEFVPLEEQQQGRTETPNINKPFDLDVVTGELGGNTDSQRPGLFFQQSFPFFGNDFFNSFAGFGIGGGPAQEPWWKGPNVCTDKEEDEKVITARDTTEANHGDNNEGDADVEEIAPGVSESIDVRPPMFGQFHFSVNSCVEKPNKYICSRIQNQNGKRKRITITRQCCHGYGRPRNADFATPCDKLDIKDIEAAATDMGAKQFVTNVKSSMADELLNHKNLTLFMPMDAAYTQYQEQVQNENNLVKSDEDMKHFYRRHVVNGELSLYDAHNEQVLKSQEEGQTIRINSYQLPRSLGREPFQYTANCVPIEKHDKLSEQGLIHTLNGVIRPVSSNLMDIIRLRPDLSIMRTVLEKTKLNEILEADKPITIFVPTDDAFDKLEPHLRRALKEGKGCASNILKNHMVDLTFCSAAALPNAKTTAYNLLGEPMRFNRSKAYITEKSEITDLLSEMQQPVVINGLAKIIDADIMGTNGVMHVINTILPTESALPMSTLMQEKNVTIFKRLIEASGLDDKFDDMDNITIFAPTDKALQGTKWSKLLSESPEQLKNNPELVDFINYHVVAPMTKTCDLTEQVMPTIDGANVRVNLYSTHSLFSNVMNRATVNCARLVHFDDESCGSVLHQVDKPLAAPKNNLLELLESNPNYSKFLGLVRSANLSDLLSQNNDDVYTLLIPKNEVFEEIEDWENTLAKDQHELEQLVKTHIVNDAVCCAGIIPTNWPFVRSIEALSGVHLRITRDRRPKIENAGVTKCDAIATNGIVHEINDIIVPTRRRAETQQPFEHEHHVDHFGDLFI